LIERALHGRAQDDLGRLLLTRPGCSFVSGPLRAVAVEPSESTEDELMPPIDVASGEPDGNQGRRSPWVWATVVAFTAFAVFEVFRILTVRDGPFLDEGIYITAGLRTLAGHGISDGYPGWFSGSLLLPVIDGVGYKLAGLAGARVMALLLVGTGCLGAVAATRLWFGPRVAFFSSVALLAAAPTLALAHLAVVDVMAVAGLGVALWGVAKSAVGGDRTWLCVAGFAYATGTLGKYPMAFTLPWILALIWITRRSTAKKDVAIFLPRRLSGRHPGLLPSVPLRAHLLRPLAGIQQSLLRRPAPDGRIRPCP
jgi:hypothetical protein